ncbi:MAG: hypothetical protein JWN76_2225 [Chitinophagaceae bacterium]|nr:hypothetical protein [Chitinophagaceae bacterium]
MKKVLALLAICATLFAVNVNAQGGGGNFDPAQRKAMMKERYKPLLVDKVKLSADQADKVSDVLIDAQMSSMQFRRDQALSDDDKKKKMDEVTTDRNKKLKDLSLTDDQIKAIDDAMAEMRKNQPQRPQGGGGN